MFSRISISLKLCFRYTFNSQETDIAIAYAKQKLTSAVNETILSLTITVAATPRVTINDEIVWYNKRFGITKNMIKI